MINKKNRKPTNRITLTVAKRKKKVFFKNRYCKKEKLTRTFLIPENSDSFPML
jgi:hypothetical protein